MKVYTQIIIDVTESGYYFLSNKFYRTNLSIPEAKGKPQQTTTQNTDPWGGQQPFLIHGFSGAHENWTKNKVGTPFFPGQTYAPMASQTRQALTQTQARALAGSPLARAGSEQMRKVAAGEYLNGPLMTNSIRAEFNKIRPELQSAASRSGNAHSSSSKIGEAEALANVIAQQYNQERNRQDYAASLAQDLALNDYNDIAKLASVGALNEEDAQKAIDEAIARHEHAVNTPYEELAKYMSIINGQYGQSTVGNTTGFKGSRGAGLLGGALGGAGLASMLGAGGAAKAGGAAGAAAGAKAGIWGGPMGLGIGALAGGLLGGLL